VTQATKLKSVNPIEIYEAIFPFDNLYLYKEEKTVIHLFILIILCTINYCLSGWRKSHIGLSHIEFKTILLPKLSTKVTF
jgi:hypothetical protein